MNAAGLGKKETAAHLDIMKELSGHISGLKSSTDKMVEERKKANTIDDVVKRAQAYCFKVKDQFEDIRGHADKLERMVDDKLWSLPKYRELLHIK